MTPSAAEISPDGGNTSALDETVRVTLTFSEGVNVTGTPRLKIKMDPTTGRHGKTQSDRVARRPPSPAGGFGMKRGNYASFTIKS